jgi:hypothetical protein
MVNPFKEVDWNPDTMARRSFAKSLIIGFPVVGLVLFFIGRISTGHWNGQVPALIVGCGVAAGILFWLIPAIAKPFYVAWYCVACSIGLVMGNLMLAIIYYLVVTPTGLLMRLAGRDPLNRKIDPKAESYWLPIENRDDPKRYYRQF